MGPIVRSQPHVRGWKPYRFDGERDEDVVRLRTVEDVTAALGGMGIEVK